MSKWCGDENCLQCVDKEPDPYVHLPREDYDALRAENARFRAVLMNMQAAWNNKNEVTSVYVWNERMKAAMADVDAALQPERGRND